MKLTKKKAFELSIEKWELIIKNDGSEPQYPEHIYGLLNYCGMCQYQHEKQIDYICDDCVLTSEHSGCCFNLYDNWESSETKEVAQEVLDLIKEKYNEYLQEDES